MLKLLKLNRFLEVLLDCWSQTNSVHVSVFTTQSDFPEQSVILATFADKSVGVLYRRIVHHISRFIFSTQSPKRTCFMSSLHITSLAALSPCRSLTQLGARTKVVLMSQPKAFRLSTDLPCREHRKNFH